MDKRDNQEIVTTERTGATVSKLITGTTVTTVTLGMCVSWVGQHISLEILCVLS